MAVRVGGPSEGNTTGQNQRCSTSARKAAMSKPDTRFSDLIACTFLCVLVFALACSFDITERFVEWAAVHGTWRIGEFLVLAVLAAVSAYVYATRSRGAPKMLPDQPQEKAVTGDLESALNRSDIAIWTVSLTDPSNVYVSPACQELWGGTCGPPEASLPGDPVGQIGNLGLPLRSAETRGASLEGEKEYRIVSKEGAVRWVSERTLLADPSDTSDAWLVGICEDITEAKRAEEERAQYNTQLFHEMKMDAVGKLAGGVAHDFNNYLTVIINEAEMLSESLADTPDRAAQASAIVGTATRASSLMRQLLAVSREQTLSRTSLAVNDLISQASERAKSGSDDQLEIVLKKSKKPLWVSADPQSMASVLDALTTNARQAMPEGGTLSLEAAAAVLSEADRSPLEDTAGFQPGKFVVLTVNDTGVGMTDDVRRHVFEPFFSSRPEGEGNGLGLATVYGIVRQHGGFVSVDSEPELGATFRVYLPQIDQPAPPPAPAPTPAARPVPSGGETILVAEDEPMVRHVAVRVLKYFGYNVLEAENGVQAMDVAGNFDGDIHVLFTDMVMPVMDGKALADRLTEQRPEIKVIFTSGYTADKLAENGIDITGGAFIQKPFTRDDIGKIIREVLGSGE